MQLYGIITVKMKSTSLTSLFFHLSNHISHWILYSQSTPESFLTHAHAGVCAHTSGAGIETSPCQLSRLTAHGSCPNPLIASQARGRKSDKGRLWRWHNKTMNKVAVKWAECVRSEEKSYQSQYLNFQKSKLVLRFPLSHLSVSLLFVPTLFSVFSFPARLSVTSEDELNRHSSHVFPYLL